MNYLKNRYNIFSLSLENLTVLPCETQKLKTLQLLYHSMITKLSTPPHKIFLNTKEMYYFTYLFTALSSNACINHEFMKLRNCWTFGTAFNRVRLIERASLRLCTGQRRTFEL